MAKKAIISTVALLLTLSLLLGLFAACGEKPIEFGPTTDNYRTMYQIFPISFADSNGDGKGDIKGIIDKLDYIADMNFDGIWLTPVHQSPSYHKYDVVDYKSIDQDLGTMEDYDSLVAECHKRGMTVILDLVINHTSDKHEWFKYACRARLGQRDSDPYYDFYNFSTTASDGWYQVGQVGGQKLYYEGQFWSGMPDLNWDDVLNNPNSALAKALEDVMRFWLIDHDVDGFRLDAVSQFFTGDPTKNIECLAWIDKTAKAIKPDCYIVGEGPWDASAYSYYNSGIDSFFLFNHGYRGDNSISMAGRGMTGAFSWFADIDGMNNRVLGKIDGSIPALFVANHDVARAIGILQGTGAVENMKMGYGVMAMCAGATFWYYGDEVGMAAYANSAGNIPDENRRQPMPWGDDYTCKPVTGSTAAEDSVKYPFGTVQENLKEKDSLINFISRANALRRAFPAIARSYGEIIFDDDDCVGIIKKGEGEDAVYIAVNLSHVLSTTVDLSRYGNFKLAGTLSVRSPARLKGNSLTLPAMSFAVLKKV